MKRTPARWIGLMTAAGLLGALVTVAPAHAAAEVVNVKCGDKFSAPTDNGRYIKLAEDVVCKVESDGVIIGTPRSHLSRFTLDLNGHSIINEFTEQGKPQVGVIVAGQEVGEGQGQSGVTITDTKGGYKSQITGFDAGITLTNGGTSGGGTRNEISHLTITKNEGNYKVGDGIVVESPGTLVLDNHVTSNGPLSGITVLQGDKPEIDNLGSGVVIERNEVVNNNQTACNPKCQSQDTGIRLEVKTNNNTVLNNIVKNNGLDGIELFAESNKNRIEKNKVTSNGRKDNSKRAGDGIRLAGEVGADHGAQENYVGPPVGDPTGGNEVHGNAGNGVGILNNPKQTSAGTNKIVFNNINGNALADNPPDHRYYDGHDLNSCGVNEWRHNHLVTKHPHCLD